MTEPTDEKVAPATPDPPPGRQVELPGRGTTFTVTLPQQSDSRNRDGLSSFPNRAVTDL